MSNFQEDPRQRRIRVVDGRRRGPIRVSDGVEGQSQNQVQNQNPNPPVNTPRPLPQRQQDTMSVYGSMWRSTPNVFSTHLNPNQSVQANQAPQRLTQNMHPQASQTDDHSNNTTEDLQRRRKTPPNTNHNENTERSTSENRFISQANQVVIQNQAPRSTQSQQQRNQAQWLVPIDGFPQMSNFNESFPVFVPRFTNRADQRLSNIGQPRRIPVSTPLSLPANTPIIPKANPPYIQNNVQSQSRMQAEPEDNFQNFTFSQYPQSNILPYPQTNSFQQIIPNNQQQNNISQSSLMQYLQNQMILLTNQINLTFAKKPHVEPLSNRFSQSTQFSSLPSSKTRFMEALQIDLSEIDFSTVIQPYYRFQFQRGRTQWNPNLTTINPKIVNYFNLFEYFVRQQTSKNKTSNMFLVLKRLEESFQKQKFSLKPEKSEFSQTKVKDLKECIPFLASIKRWYERINANLKICKEKLANIQVRTTNTAESNLMKLKHGASQSKKSLKILISAKHNLCMIKEQMESADNLLRMHSLVGFQFDFGFPDDGMVKVCQQVYDNFKQMLAKTSQFECFYPKRLYGERQEFRNADAISLHFQLINKLALQCGNLEDLQAKVRKMKAKLSKKQKNEPLFTDHDEKTFGYFKKAWRVVNLLREAQSIIKNRRKRQMMEKQ